MKYYLLMLCQSLVYYSNLIFKCYSPNNTVPKAAALGQYLSISRTHSMSSWTHDDWNIVPPQKPHKWEAMESTTHTHRNIKTFFSNKSTAVTFAIQGLRIDRKVIFLVHWWWLFLSFYTMQKYCMYFVSVQIILKWVFIAVTTWSNYMKDVFKFL